MGEMITYEELFELLRRERTGDELEVLDENFYENLVRYLEEKNRVLSDDSQEAQLFGASEKENVGIQLQNAKKLAKEIIERREKKIIALALTKARTRSDVIDTTALLPVEKELFSEAAMLFEKYRGDVVERIIGLKMPLSAGESSETENTVGVSETVDESSKVEESVETPENGLKTTKSVRFKSSVPKFLGKNQEVYGPYEADQEATLSAEIADVLIGKDRAEEIEDA